jgi:hypothetical protein
LDGWNAQDGMVPKKEHCFILNDDGLRLHCDKTKKAPPHLGQSFEGEKDFPLEDGWYGCKDWQSLGGVWFSYRWEENTYELVRTVLLRSRFGEYFLLIP